jgi:glycosyltransferase involved in cell wall biosynthesis
MRKDIMSDQAIVIASTTLTGNNASIIADAIKSAVDWVDICLVIDTGVTDDTLHIAREIAGSKYVERRFDWIGDFSAARNFALDAAHEIGAHWAVTLDTDERIHPEGVDLRGTLSSASEGVLMLSHAARTYAKERFFRLPCPERFSGPTHESFPAYKLGSRTLERAHFSELGKTPEQLRRKFLRDAEILRPYITQHPRDARWHYYLGDSLKNLGEWQKAVDAYDACTALRGWNEESAWACYQAADCLSRLGRYREAIERCAVGLTRHAGIAELCWLAGFAAYKLKDNAQAVYWSRLSIAQGLFKGEGAKVSPRIGFRNPNALYEGPYDILRFALRGVGDPEGAARAERLYHEAIAARLAAQGLKPSVAAPMSETRNVAATG